MNERIVLSSILENLSRLSPLEDKEIHYRNILKMVRKSKQEITRNVRGYWFDLTLLESSIINDIHSYLENISYDNIKIAVH